MYDEDENDAPTQVDAVVAPNDAITVTINMDKWLSGSVNDVLVNSLTHALSAKLKDQVGKAVQEKVFAMVDEQFQALAASKLEEFFTMSHQKTNTWGEKTGQSYTIRELLMDRFKGYLDAKVDANNGSESTYSGSIRRVDFMLNQLAHKPLRDAIDETVKAFSAQAKAAIQTNVARYITEQLAPTISIPSLSK